jgi:hypothetical protein
MLMSLILMLLMLLLLMLVLLILCNDAYVINVTTATERPSIRVQVVPYSHMVASRFPYLQAWQQASRCCAT